MPQMISIAIPATKLEKAASVLGVTSAYLLKASAPDPDYSKEQADQYDARRIGNALSVGALPLATIGAGTGALSGLAHAWGEGNRNYLDAAITGSLMGAGAPLGAGVGAALGSATGSLPLTAMGALGGGLAGMAGGGLLSRKINRDRKSDGDSDSDDSDDKKKPKKDKDKEKRSSANEESRPTGTLTIRIPSDKLEKVAKVLGVSSQSLCKTAESATPSLVKTTTKTTAPAPVSPPAPTPTPTPTPTPATTPESTEEPLPDTDPRDLPDRPSRIAELLGKLHKNRGLTGLGLLGGGSALGAGIGALSGDTGRGAIVGGSGGVGAVLGGLAGQQVSNTGAGLGVGGGVGALLGALAGAALTRKKKKKPE